MVRRALLCGINNYKSVRDLRGCLRDVENLRALLVSVYGFQEGDIRTLIDQDVVKPRLREEWKRLLHEAGPGDLLVFHFSGHGSFLKDDNQDEEEDRNDEILCLHDMDFANPDSFLRDDEFGAWTAEKPAGAELILLTDCCHSGTNTRMLVAESQGRLITYALNQRATLKLVEKTGETAPEATEVIARFLPPPGYFPGREAQMRRRRAAPGAAPGAAPRALNHLHLGACQDFQEAADAPLEGRYNGAFTYYLCKTLTAEPGLSSRDLITRLTGLLADFGQKPQENGGPRRGPIFGGQPALPPVVPDEPAATRPLREETARELITAVRELTESLKRSGPRRSRAGGQRVLVYVHGIDEHPGDYSLPWWNSLRRHLNGLFGEGNLGETRLAVHWSDIVNPRSLGASRSGAPNAEANVEIIRQMLEREILEGSARYAQQNRRLEARRTLEPLVERRLATRGGGPQIDDFLRYMFFPSVRSAVLERFYDVVRPRLADGDTIDIIAHSWGAVVTFEGLLQLESEGLPGRVANYFTVGGALARGTVRWTLSLGGRRPAQVGRWFNLNAKGDSIGGSIGSYFPIDEPEYLDLEPTECDPGWWGYDLGCAHSSYFKKENDAVNEAIFARHLLQE